MMPMYSGIAVTDEYLQGLLGCYRAGVEREGGEPDESDAPVQARLEAEDVKTEKEAEYLGQLDELHRDDHDDAQQQGEG